MPGSPIEDAAKELQSLCSEECGTDEQDKMEIIERYFPPPKKVAPGVTADRAAAQRAFEDPTWQLEKFDHRTNPLINGRIETGERMTIILRKK